MGAEFSGVLPASLSRSLSPFLVRSVSPHLKGDNSTLRCGRQGAVFGESVQVVGNRYSRCLAVFLPFVLSRPAGTGTAAAFPRLRGAV